MNLTWLLNGDHPTTLRARAKAAKNHVRNPAVRDVPIRKQFLRRTNVIEEVEVGGGGSGESSVRRHTGPLIGFGKKRRDGTVSSRGSNVSLCLHRTRNHNGTEQHRTLPAYFEGGEVGGVEASALYSD